MAERPCPACGQPNLPGKRFCRHCGAALPRACPSCGADVLPDARFCDDCGAPLASAASRAAAPAPTPPDPARLGLSEQLAVFQRALPPSVHQQVFVQEQGENRVLTILFADLSGSTAAIGALAPEDAAALLQEVLQAMVEAIVAHGGRINQVLGDAVLAFFGTPVAHENDAERAIRAALQIREAVQGQGLNATVGINSGEVYLGELGRGPQQEVRAVGSAVNLAARLQQKAQPGHILVGEGVYRQTHRAFAFARHELEAKGFAEPVAAYEVLRALPHPEKVRGIEGLRAALVGREKELAGLSDALAAVQAGRGQIVTLIGEAGVGKSRLIAELKELALTPVAGQPLPLWLEGRCLDVGMAVSYWPFLDLLRAHFAFTPEDDDRARGARISSSVEVLVGRGDLPAARAEEMLPLLGHLLGARFGSELDEHLKTASPEQIKHQTFLTLVDLFVALARPQPLILVLEDLHWADSLSLDLVSLLMESLRLAPLLLVCVYRPEQDHKCWHLGAIATRKCHERFTEIQLKELTAAQSRRLVETLLHIEALPSSVKEQILGRAQGNPFFVEEVVRSLIDADLVYHDGAAWRAREEIAEVAVPESIQSVILSRVDRLEAETRHVLQSAAVIGRLFRRRLLEHLAQQEVELDRALAELEDRQLIYAERAIPEEEYSFHHVLAQETVYHNILRRRRVVFHQQVAEAMERLYGDNLEEYYEQLAHHYAQAEAWPKALEYLMKAGDKAAAAYANADAIAFYTRALEVCDGLGDGALSVAAAAAQKRGDVHLRVEDPQAAVADYDLMCAIGRRLGDRRLEGLALVHRGNAEVESVWQRSDSLEAAEQTLHDALTIAEEGYADVRLGALAGLVSHHVVTGRLAEAEAAMREAAEVAPQVQESTVPRPDWWRFYFYNWSGRFGEAIAELDYVRAISPNLEDVAVLCWDEALVRAGRGEYQQALALLAEGLAARERMVQVPSQALNLMAWIYQVLLNTMGWVHGEIQNHERALEWNTRGLAVAEDGDLREYECVNHARLNLGDSLAALGRLDEAEEQFRVVEHRVRQPRPQDRWMLWRYAQHLFHSYGELWLTRGDAARALASADECLERAEQTGSRKNIVKGRRLRGQALLAEGKLAEAEQELVRALELAQEVGNPPQLWKTLVALGDLRTAQGRTDEAQASYRAALAVIEGVAAGLEDAELRETFLSSAHVQQVRRLAQ
jgi:class 3 adenylate cyclase/tetratricopeptide (TPR) repeat protein